LEVSLPHPPGHHQGETSGGIRLEPHHVVSAFATVHGLSCRQDIPYFWGVQHTLPNANVAKIVATTQRGCGSSRGQEGGPTAGSCCNTAGVLVRGCHPPHALCFNMPAVACFAQPTARGWLLSLSPDAELGQLPSRQAATKHSDSSSIALTMSVCVL